MREADVRNCGAGNPNPRFCCLPCMLDAQRGPRLLVRAPVSYLYSANDRYSHQGVARAEAGGSFGSPGRLSSQGSGDTRKHAPPSRRAARPRASKPGCDQTRAGEAEASEKDHSQLAISPRRPLVLAIAFDRAHKRTCLRRTIERAPAARFTTVPNPWLRADKSAASNALFAG